MEKIFSQYIMKGSVFMKRAHEVEFNIYGDDMQFVEIVLDSREAIIAEAGAMMYMDEGIIMDSIFGDGSERKSGGITDKLFGAGKRLLTGESLFMTRFENTDGFSKKVAFSAPYPGKIIPMDLMDEGGTIICQKDAFLCAAHGISVDIAFQKKIGVGIFGGEGFIMQKLSGDGLSFLHAGGAIIEKYLQPGECIKIDTGCLVAMNNSVDYNIEVSGNVKTALFGGEGLFLATLRGPGKVWLQSLPFSRLANRMYSAATKAGGKSKGEGSLLNIGLDTFFGND